MKIRSFTVNANTSKNVIFLEILLINDMKPPPSSIKVSNDFFIDENVAVMCNRTLHLILKWGKEPIHEVLRFPEGREGTEAANFLPEESKFPTDVYFSCYIFFFSIFFFLASTGCETSVGDFIYFIWDLTRQLIV